MTVRRHPVIGQEYIVEETPEKSMLLDQDTLVPTDIVRERVQVDVYTRDHDGCDHPVQTTVQPDTFERWVSEGVLVESEVGV